MAEETLITIPLNAKNVKVSFDIETPPVPNKPPLVNAGADQTIKLPTGAVTLRAIASDDGVIAMTTWDKVGSSTSTIESPKAITTVISGLTEGIHIFKMTVVDNLGASTSDDIRITVLAADVVTPPVEDPDYILTFQTGLDTQADMLYKGNGQYGNSTISTTVFKIPPGSFYSKPAEVSSGKRGEIQYGGSEVNNIEGKIKFDVRFEVIVPNNGHWLQWHPNPGGTSASPGLWFVGGRTYAMNATSPDGTSRDQYNQEHPTSFTPKTNIWYGIEIQYKFGSNGYFRMFVDGNKVVEWNGLVGFDGNNPSGQYFKLGYNGWDAQSLNSRIYYDNLKVYKKRA